MQRRHTNTRVRTSALVVSTFGSLWLAASGCSVLYDFNTNQCNSTNDCIRKGSAFQNSICKNRVCVAVAAVGGAPSAGGQTSLATGGATSAGGDTSMGGAGGAGGTTSTSSTGLGTGGASACTNAKCIESNNGAPAICRSGVCVPLTSKECPVLIPAKTASELIKKDGVIIVGGFANMGNTADLHDSLAIVNWDMAFDEFNSSTLGGLPNVGGSGTRPFVGLICHSEDLTTYPVNTTMQHLSGELQLPALLSTLSTNFLYQVWQYLTPGPDLGAGAPPEPMFIMSTGSADLRLANLADDGLMWHMLGDPRVLAATTAGLMKQIEPYVNAQRLALGDNPTTNPLRVTLVYSDDPTMIDAASILTQLPEDTQYPGTALKFNGKLALSNGTAFRQVKIESATQHTSPVVSNAIADLQDNPPHVIVAMATYEFPQRVIATVENTWGANAPGQTKPFYLMSHRMFNRPELSAVMNQFSTGTSPMWMRTVGVNFARSHEQRAQDLYTVYLSKLKGIYQGKLQLDSTENYYDGAYYLLYSIAAAGATRAKPSASDIVAGLTTRIISKSSGASSVNVGFDPIAGTATGTGTITQLFGNPSGYKMSLYGCSGPPNFDPLTGARVTETSAWCVFSNGTTSVFQSDGLDFDSSTKTFSAPAAGIPTCLQNYCKAQADSGVGPCPQDY